MSDARERGDAATWPPPRVAFVAGVVVAGIGLWLAVGSDNPVWLSLAQVCAGVVMAVSAWRSGRRGGHHGRDA